MCAAAVWGAYCRRGHAAMCVADAGPARRSCVKTRGRRCASPTRDRLAGRASRRGQRRCASRRGVGDMRLAAGKARFPREAHLRNVSLCETNLLKFFRDFPTMESHQRSPRTGRLTLRSAKRSSEGRRKANDHRSTARHLSNARSTQENRFRLQRFESFSTVLG